MKDREFLIWIHERLEHVNGESRLVDYMHNLRSIIRATPKDRETLNCVSGNSMQDLKEILAMDDALAARYNL